MKDDAKYECNVIGICKDCAFKMYQIWQEENKNTIIRPGDYIKIRMGHINPDGGEVFEHVWFKVKDIPDKDIYTCVLDNDPIKMKDVKHGDIYAVKFESIENHIPAGMSNKEFFVREEERMKKFKELNFHTENHEKSNEAKSQDQS